MSQTGTSFRLLRDVAAESGGAEIQLGSPRERLVLAVLLLNGGELVTVDQLIDRLWDGSTEVPAKPRELVREHVKRLRSRLRQGGTDDLIPRGTNGYRALVPRSQVDVHRFHDLLNQARAQSAPRNIADGLRAALTQWDPESLALTGDESLPGLPGQWVEAVRQGLSEEYRSTRVMWMETELSLGEHQRLIPELTRAVTQGLLDERLTELLMLALHRAGRTAEALEAFVRFRDRLDAELFMAPGHALKELYQRVLADDPALQPPSPGVTMNETADANTLASDAAQLVADYSQPVGGGQAVAPTAFRLVQRVSAQFAGLDGEQSALTWVQDSPDDPEALNALRERLLRHLQDDPAFARNVARLVRGASQPDERPTVHTGDIGNFANVYGNNIGTYNMNAPQPPAPKEQR